MLNLLLKPFRKNVVPPPLDIEKAVGHYLLSLPRCTNRILVIGRNYPDYRFHYELTVDAKFLAAWATKHAESVWSSLEPVQAARKSLPLWLNGADLTDNFGTVLPLEFYKIISEYHEVLTQMAGSQMYCHGCRQIIEDLTKKNTDLPPSGIFNCCWRSEWYCSQGHLLYQEEFGMHMTKRRNRFPELDLNNKSELTEPAFLRKFN